MSPIWNTLKFLSALVSLHQIRDTNETLRRKPDVVPGTGSRPRNWSKNLIYWLMFLLIASIPNKPKNDSAHRNGDSSGFNTTETSDTSISPAPQMPHGPRTRYAFPILGLPLAFRSHKQHLQLDMNSCYYLDTWIWFTLLFCLSRDVYLFICIWVCSPFTNNLPEVQLTCTIFHCYMHTLENWWYGICIPIHAWGFQIVHEKIQWNHVQCPQMLESSLIYTQLSL